MHNVEAGKRYRILTVQIAVPADIGRGEVAGAISALLTDNGIAMSDGVVADWGYAPDGRGGHLGPDGPETPIHVIPASDVDEQVSENEIFHETYRQ